MTKVHDFCDYIHVFNAGESTGIIYEIVRSTVLPDMANRVAILLGFHITLVTIDHDHGSAYYTPDFWQQTIT